jgi:hypothetical protein
MRRTLFMLVLSLIVAGSIVGSAAFLKVNGGVIQVYNLGDYDEEWTRPGSREGTAEPSFQAGFSCSHPAAYWRDHLEAWPFDQIEIGWKLFNQAQALEVLDLVQSGELHQELAGQLVWAKLNLGNEAEGTIWQKTLSAAGDWLSRYDGSTDVSGAAREQGSQLVVILNGLNTGQIGPGLCSEGNLQPLVTPFQPQTATPATTPTPTLDPGFPVEPSPFPAPTSLSTFLPAVGGPTEPPVIQQPSERLERTPVLPELPGLSGLRSSCTYPKAYWLENPAAWPAAKIPVGEAFIGSAQARRLLLQIGGDNTHLKLTQSLIVIKLNLWGQPARVEMMNTIQRAEAWLVEHPQGMGIDENEEMLGRSLIQELEDYIYGITGPGLCESSYLPPISAPTNSPTAVTPELPAAAHTPTPTPLTIPTQVLTPQDAAPVEIPTQAATPASSADR